MNLSSPNIPHDVQLLLQLGEKFCLPNIDKEKTVIELLKNVEFNIGKLSAEVHATVRGRSFPIMNRFHSSLVKLSPTDRLLLKAFDKEIHKE